RRGIRFTIESELHSTESEFRRKIADYLINAERDQKSATLFVCTLLRMDQPDTEIVPNYLWKMLEVQEVHKAFFSRYIQRLNEYLKGESEIADAFAFVQQMNALGQIEKHCKILENQYERIDRTGIWLHQESLRRELSRNFLSALEQYVLYL